MKKYKIVDAEGDVRFSSDKMPFTESELKWAQILIDDYPNEERELYPKWFPMKIVPIEE